MFAPAQADAWSRRVSGAPGHPLNRKEQPRRSHRGNAALYNRGLAEAQVNPLRVEILPRVTSATALSPPPGRRQLLQHHVMLVKWKWRPLCGNEPADSFATFT